MSNRRADKQQKQQRGWDDDERGVYLRDCDLDDDHQNIMMAIIRGMLHSQDAFPDQIFH